MERIWSVIDITTLRDWPDYPPGDADRFTHVDWPTTCEIAIELAPIGRAWSPIKVPQDAPDDVRTGLELLLVAPPIDATPEQLIDGGHRLVAMRSQGVRFTVGASPNRTKPFSSSQEH